MKRSPMIRGKGSRTKGGTGEREVVEMLHAAGFTGARRNFQSGGQGGGDIVGVPDVHLEVKRQETVSIWKWIGQAEGEAARTALPLVVFRRSHSSWYAVLSAQDLFGLLQELQELRGAL